MPTKLQVAQNLTIAQLESILKAKKQAKKHSSKVVPLELKRAKLQAKLQAVEEKLAALTGSGVAAAPAKAKAAKAAKPAKKRKKLSAATLKRISLAVSKAQKARWAKFRAAKKAAAAKKPAKKTAKKASPPPASAEATQA